MKTFHKLNGWNKQRDEQRRIIAEKFLNFIGINFEATSKGCYKIYSKKYHTVMFYPKSGVIIWKETKRQRQHKYVNSDSGNIARKLKELSQ